MIDESRIMRRVTGQHDLRLDGIGDLLFRARGASVLDVGCNKGMAGYEFACNGARLVHGFDKYELGITIAREIFAEVPNVRSRFEVVDLIGGTTAIHKAFGKDYGGQYDIMLLLAIYHKLKRIMDPSDLLKGLASCTGKYIGWRGLGSEVNELDTILGDCGFKRIQYSEISESICPAGIWRRFR